ncbi:hypothetical protein [Nostocoides sp. HKS02]|uniref:hypothetical protein n=1 Tax=Nostocoides sp. HKS02 TaxID=1813880 RepID=UPI0012B4F230|nr:hypothetical protein [Tetrasphaera sp. HKS02]QGN57576.1 hypothetical protein GKE56_06485 [Tetrasphaera sp. HKS02]
MTVISWVLMLTVLTIAEPTVKLALSSLAIHLSAPVWTPVSGAVMVTLVPGCQ